MLGVELFVVPSGFVLAPQICTVIGRGRSTRNIAIFWVRRWMRSVPAYVIAMLAVSITAHECGQVTFFDTRSVDSIAYGFLLHLAMQRADIFRHDFRWLIQGGLLLTEAITPSWYSLPAHLFPFYQAFVGAAAILLALRLDTMVAKSRALTALGLFSGRLSYSTWSC
ncbi:peptidoglycan/LPS O-acetylase OafA/YrhL [Bradyrhizobium sp. USDA 4449]